MEELTWGLDHPVDLFRCDHPFFSKKGEGDISQFIETYMNNYQLTDGKGLICIPSGNHDMDRISRRLDEEELKIAFAFLLSMPGSPFIYYGDEIGMRYLEGLTSVEGGYERTGARTPMQWNNKKNAGFSSADESELYIMQDPSGDRPSAEKMQEEKDSLWHEIQTLIHIRMKEEALCANGKIEILYAKQNKYPLIYKRTGETDSIVVVINPSAEKIECELLEEANEVIYAYNEPAIIQNGKVTVYPCSATFIRV
jgi:maltose alpha-D-glucosyltransferase/alpha-amylase